MEPRPYQAEAFDAARKSNIVMVGATGVGKTLVSLMLIRDFYFEDARRMESETHKWCVFLCPTQELVFQQAKSAQIFTGVRCGSYVGKDLDYWGLKKWREEMDSKDVLVMTPNALLNLLYRGKEYLSLSDVGVLVFDECHQARKKHPYARVMTFYVELKRQGGPLPKVFGMTASPTVECVEVLQCKAYVCEDKLIEDFQANAQWELLPYPSFAPSPIVVHELEAILRMLFSEVMCSFSDTKERFVDTVVMPVLFSYQHLGLWCAMRHVVVFCEGFLKTRKAQGMKHKPRIIRVRKVVTELNQRLNESSLVLAAAGVEQSSRSASVVSPMSSRSEECQSSGATAADEDKGPDDARNITDSASSGAGAAGSGSCVTDSGSGLGSDTGFIFPVPVKVVDGAVPEAADRSDGACSTGERNVENGDNAETRHVGVGVGDSQASSPPRIHDSALPPLPESHAIVTTSAELSRDDVSDISQHGGGIDGHGSVVNGVGNSSFQGGGVEESKEDKEDVEKQSDVQNDADASDAKTKEAEAAAKAWGITPARVTMLVKTLLKEADEWGEDAKHLRCMVFVERRSTARVLSECLLHCLKGRLMCGFVVGRSSSSSRVRISSPLSRRGKDWKFSSKDIVPEDLKQQQQREGSMSPVAVPGSVSGNANGNIDKEEKEEEEEKDCVDVGLGEFEARRGRDCTSPRGQGANEFKAGRAAQTINLFRHGEIQQPVEAYGDPFYYVDLLDNTRSHNKVLVTTDACSEGIDVPECNVVISMDRIKCSRSLIHTRGRARSKGGKFVIMVEDENVTERERISQMLLESEDIKRFQLDFEKPSQRVPLRQAHPAMVHKIESSGAIVDMDMSTSLLFDALSAMGCDYHPLLVVEDSGVDRPSWMIKGPSKVSYRCRLELPSFLNVGTVDTDTVSKERFWTKAEARSAVCYLAVLKMLEKGYIDERLNPRRTNDRLVVESRKTYDPVVVVGKESRAKATMPVPRPIAMGILPTPNVDFKQAWLLAWNATCVLPETADSPRRKGLGFQRDPGMGRVGGGISGSPKSISLLTNGTAPRNAEVVAAGIGGGEASTTAGDAGASDVGAALDLSGGELAMNVDHAEEESNIRDGVGVVENVRATSEFSPSAEAVDAAAAAGSGSATWKDAPTGGCYEGVPGPKRRMRIYCFRSPPGEVDGWVPATAEPRIRKGFVRGARRSATGKKEGEGKEGSEAEGKEGGEAEGKGVEGETTQKKAATEDDADDGGNDDESDLRTFHPKLMVDVGRGPGEGVGPRLFVGLASAAPLPLTASQAAKVGIEDSFDTDLNPAQMAAIVQWHRETLGMVALYEIPHQLTRTPQNDPEKCPFRDVGDVGDKGMVAVPIEYGDDGLDDSMQGTPRIDWAAIEAANAGVHLPADTDKDYTRRILFSRVSHKTCRFYFVIERTSTTLGDYLRRCLESDLGPYAGLPCEIITQHPSGQYGRVRGALAVGHGVRKPDYEAAYKSQRLLLGVPAPALRHSFAQHLIRGERVMDPDAGVRRRVMVSRGAELEQPDVAPAATDNAVDDEPEANPEGAAEGDEVSRESKVRAMDVDEDDDDATEDAPDVKTPTGGEAGKPGGEVCAVKDAGGAAWAGVSTLKSNRHRVGTAQPVLLVEQYTQAVCMTRRVFVSVLHVVPRMFDIERQLLCFVLHEAVFLPALEASLHRRSPPTSCTKAVATSNNDGDEVDGGTQAAIEGSEQSSSAAKVLKGEGIGSSGGAPRDSNAAETSLNPPDLDTVPNVIRKGVGLSNTAETPAHPSDMTVPCGGGEEAAVAIERWPPNGVWNIPGRGAGTGCGPGGAMDSGGVDIHSSAKMEEAALRAEAAAAEAAAIGVFQWQGQDDAGVDTVALLDCSLRRPVNERLETLGDAWLNYYAGFVVFQDKPVMMEEGMMTLLRKNVVSNARLIKCADGRGLREFMYPPRSILGRPFDMWSPSLLPLPPPVKASRKTIADMVEAILGAALVAGGNRCAAFLMEWLGLPTLEASNAPDKLKKGTDEPVPDLKNRDNATGGETRQSRGSEVVVDELDDGGGKSNPSDGAEDCLRQGEVDVTSPVGGQGVVGGVSVGEMGDGSGGGGGGDSEWGGEVSSDLTVSCDPMDDGGSSGIGSSGNGNESGIGNGSEVGTGSKSSSEGESGSVQSGTSSKRKSSGSQLVDPPKRIRTPEGGRVPATGNGEEMTLAELPANGAARESRDNLNFGESSDVGGDATAAAEVTVTANDDVTNTVDDDITVSKSPRTADGNEDSAAAEAAAAETEGVEEDSGDEGNASDIDRKLLVDATAVGKRKGSRSRKPLPNHAPDVDDKARSWLWKPPAYILLGGGDYWTTGHADEPLPCEGDPSATSYNTTVKPQLPRTACGGEIDAGSEMDCPDEAQGTSASAAASAAATPSEAATALLGSSKKGGGVRESPEDAMEMVDENRPMQQGQSVSNEETPATLEPQSQSTDNQDKDAGEEFDRVEEGAAKEGEGEVQKKWKGLLLEGLKESARWPIRRESLMSMGFLVETGVLPKVYMTTKPSARLMGSIRRVERKLSYTFKRPWLCMQAITHPSWTMFDRAWQYETIIEPDGAGNAPPVSPSDFCCKSEEGMRGNAPSEPGTVPAQDYQRLEFLGDAVLGWLVTAHLYFASSDFTPAELTRIKSSCVCNASLWLIALKLDIHNVLRASPKILGNIHAFIESHKNNKAQSGKNTTPKHPADVLEALIGAVFLDSSCCMETVSRVFWPLIARHLQENPPPPAEEELDGTVIARKQPSLTPPSEPVTPSPESAPVPMVDEETNGTDRASGSAGRVSSGNNASPDRGVGSGMGDEPGEDEVGGSKGVVKNKSSSSKAETDENRDMFVFDDGSNGGGAGVSAGEGSAGGGLKAGGFVCHSCAAGDAGDCGDGLDDVDVAPMAVDGDVGLK